VTDAPGPDQDDTLDDGRDAQSVYDEFVRRRRAGKDADLDEICDRHPDLAHALRAIHSLAVTPSAKTGDVDDASARPAGIEAAVAAVRAEERGDDVALPLEPGTDIGPYRIRDAVGEGGFAVVYRAEQQSPVRRTVAVKAIKAGLDTKQVLARFEAERQALALMSHGNVAKVFDAGTTAAGRPYFVMEFVDGAPITQYCDEHHLGTRERLDLFLQVCEGIQHAHQTAIIHRDLKPANILVTLEGERPVPKVIDFGIAKATGTELTDSTLRTEVGQIVGTPAYMSPEQAEGTGALVDTRTDIYALGVLLYELLAGERPFDFSQLGGFAIAEIQRVIREEEPPRPSVRLRQRANADIATCRHTTISALSRELRGDLDWIVMKALAKRPDDRYASASEFAADVRRYQRTEPVLAGPPSLRYRLGKVIRRRRRVLIAAGLVVVSAAIAAIVAWQWVDARRRVDAERRAAELLESGRQSFGEARATRRELLDLLGELDATRQRLETWLPVWERYDEFVGRGKTALARGRLERQFAAAFEALTESFHVAPGGSPTVREAALEVDRLREEVEASSTLISVSAALLPDQDEMAAAAGSVTGTFSLASDPPGADVYCFRYVGAPGDDRLVPRPFHLAERRWIGPEVPRVERVWDAGRARARDANGEFVEFRPGDRWLSITRGGIGSSDPLDSPQWFTTRGDIARALAEVGAGEVVTLQIERVGERLALEWVPFPAVDLGEPYTAGRLIDLRDQLGITFESWPLVFDAACHAGKTRVASPVRVELPPGSYLFVLRREGRLDTRYPVVSPRDLEDTVRLLAPEEVPPGFVHVPAGTFKQGGNDPNFLQNLPYAETRLDGFFISRLETSLGEYLEFVRDRADAADGSCVPRSPDVSKEYAAAGRISLVPTIGRDDRPLIVPDGDSWIVASPYVEESPLQGISYLTALEYAHWRTEQSGGRWRFRLPTDPEWEKAARGADGRVFVWGDHMIWSYCRSRRGVHDARRGLPRERGRSPIDESVYGVRDLAGSIVEFAVGFPAFRKRYRSCRGGGWSKIDEYRFRTDSRFGLLPEATRTSSGIRLVVDVPQASD